jgi:formylglycine-generating enzyme required for sulfatase activity
MCKAWTWLLTLALALGMPAITSAQQAAKQPTNIILIGWDGAQLNHVSECLSRKELPNLQKLIDQGTFIQITIEGTTDTKAGWSQILTGYYPEFTGVFSNDLYQPIPKGLSIFERLEEHFGADNFVTVAVIGKKTHCGEIDPPKKIRVGTDDEKKVADANNPEGEIVEEDGVKYRVIPGSPYFNMYTALDVWEFGLMQDEKVGTRAMELLEKYKDKPFFFFVNFAEVDDAGHKYGENSNEYNDALISNDLWTGKIMDKVKELGLADKTQFYVTSDHGFDEGGKGHIFAPYVFLATNNRKVSRIGRRQDIAPTILEAFGLDLSKVEPSLDGISLTEPDNRPPAKIRPPKIEKQVKKDHAPEVGFISIPQEVVEEMLKLAQVKKDDVVYNLGCGDGRIVVTAAKTYGCKVVGYEIDPECVKLSLENVAKNKVGDLVRIEQKDIFTVDLSDADVVALYLLPWLNVRLIPQLEKLKPGSRIVSYTFDMQGVEPDKVVRVNTGQDNVEHKVYLWTSPLKKIDTDRLFVFSSEVEPSGRAVAIQSAPAELDNITQAPKEKVVGLGKGLKMEFVLIPAGQFNMGSPLSEKDRGDDEGPVHPVKISKPFYMSKFEVTQEQYLFVMGSNPSRLVGPNRPVDCVTWYEAVEFCRKLTQLDGNYYRLPTEAEWEYACRAGTQTRFYYGDDPDYSQLAEYACYPHNSRGTFPVGQKKANAFGLYDMHGNVQEWCSDWYDEYYYRYRHSLDPQGPPSGQGRVLRGGAWYRDASLCRCASRFASSPAPVRLIYGGIRVVQDLY